MLICLRHDKLMAMNQCAEMDGGSMFMMIGTIRYWSRGPKGAIASGETERIAVSELSDFGFTC